MQILLVDQVRLPRQLICGEVIILAVISRQEHRCLHRRSAAALKS